MKNRKLVILLIALLIFGCVCLLTLMVFLLQGKFRFHGFSLYQTVSSHLAVDEVYSNDFEKVSIEIGSGDIFVHQSEDEQVHVRVYSDHSDVDVTTKDHQLRVYVPEKNCYFFCFERKISKIEIFLPQDYANSILVKNQFGDTDIDEFRSARITVDGKYGDISILEGDSVTIRNDYGDIRLEKAQDAKIQVSAGEIVIGTVYNANIRNNYGDIRIRKVENHLDIEEDCGDIEIGEVSLKENSSIENSYGDIEIGFTNEIYIQGETNLGQVRISKNYPKADVILRLKNSCGDIEVDN